jgi:MFS family permease
MISGPKSIPIDRRIVIFLIGMALTQFSTVMPLIQIPVYIRELGASIIDVGVFFTVSMIFPLLVKLLGGWLSDSLGRLRVIFIGSLTGVLTYAAYAIAPSWQAALVAPALNAITASLTIPAYFAFIADITPESSRGRMYGIAQTVTLAAAVVAPPIGGLIGASMGYRVMFAVSTVVFGVSALIFFYLLRTAPSLQVSEQEFSARSFRTSLSQMAGLFMAGGVVTWILIVDGVRDIAFKLSFDLMPVYLSDIASINKEGLGLIAGIHWFARLISLYPAGVLVDRTSERTGIVAALVSVISSRLVFALSEDFLGFAASGFLLGIGGSLFQPAGSSLITKVVPRHLRGIAFGLLATSLSIFSLPAPWIGSQIWELLGPKFPFLLTVVLGSLVILPAWYKLVVPPKSDRIVSGHEAATFPTIGHSETATVLHIGFESERASDLEPAAKEILELHGGVLNRTRSGSLTACFGISPHRAPPQVSALLATHAAMALVDHVNTRNKEAGERPIQVGVGIATGEVKTGPNIPGQALDQGVVVGDTVTVLGDLLRQAQTLQRFADVSVSAAVIVSERTHEYLSPAHHQFEFGRSGPVSLPGEDGEPTAYEVIGRRQTLDPELPGE